MFVLNAGCPECGYELHDPLLTAARLAQTVPRWTAVLDRADVAQRPDPTVWSPLEYACHSRDMVRVLGERVEAMVRQDNPQFANWDGDDKAVELNYWAADPTEIAEDIAAQTEHTIQVLNRLGPEQWEHTGHRSDGAPFTVTTLCRYLLHDIEHHLGDVNG